MAGFIPVQMPFHVFLTSRVPSVTREGRVSQRPYERSSSYDFGGFRCFN